MADSPVPTSVGESFVNDHRDKPALHRLYVKWAMRHLVVIDECIEKLYRPNFNWTEPRAALFRERTKLLKEDTAYQEAAWRILAGQIVRETEDHGDRLEIYDPDADCVIPEVKKPLR